jgi:Ca-activated chloride channel homolog
MRLPSFRSSIWIALLGWALSALTPLNGQTSSPSPAAPPPSASDNANAPAQPVPEQPSPGQAGSQSSPTPPAEQEPAIQEAGPDDQNSMFVFKKVVEEVVLHATVVNEQQNIVTGLDRSAFTVFDNGVPQTVTSFRAEDIPVAMGILVDNSGSMRDKREKIAHSVLNLVGASNPKDQVFVVNFNDNPYLDQDFTGDVKLLQVALRRTSTAGSTALYDAVVASSKHLQKDATLEKRVLLVVTDGRDNMSRDTLQDAMRQMQQPNGPILYAIGLQGSSMGEQGRQALQKLAESSGGAAYFLNTLDEVDNLTRSIAHDIRTQYMIAYRPRNQNGKPEYQTIRVEAQAAGRGKLTVRTRNGYYPPTQ